MTETLEQAVRRLAAAPLGEGYVLAAVHTYSNVDGTAIFWRIRLKHPASGEKWIRPMKQADEGYVIGEPEFHAGKPLYRLHDLIARPRNVVVVVEGGGVRRRPREVWCAGDDERGRRFCGARRLVRPRRARGPRLGRQRSGRPPLRRDGG